MLHIFINWLLQNPMVKFVGSCTMQRFYFARRCRSSSGLSRASCKINGRSFQCRSPAYPCRNAGMDPCEWPYHGCSRKISLPKGYETLLFYRSHIGSLLLVAVLHLFGFTVHSVHAQTPSACIYTDSQKLTDSVRKLDERYEAALAELKNFGPFSCPEFTNPPLGWESKH